jgi:hypothetical protein
LGTSVNYFPGPSHLRKGGEKLPVNCRRSQYLSLRRTSKVWKLDNPFEDSYQPIKVYFSLQDLDTGVDAVEAVLGGQALLAHHLLLLLQNNNK